MLHNFTCEEISWLFDKLPGFKVSMEETYPWQQEFIMCILGQPVLAKTASFSVRDSFFAAFNTDYEPSVRGMIAYDKLPDLRCYLNRQAYDKMINSWAVIDTGIYYTKFKYAIEKTRMEEISKYGKAYTPNNIKQHFAKEAHICRLRV